MRTSVEISAPLMKRIRALMKRRGVTLRGLIEEGLQRVLEDDAARPAVALEDAAFTGELGFAPGVTAEDLPQRLAELNAPRIPADLSNP